MRKRIVCVALTALLVLGCVAMGPADTLRQFYVEVERGKTDAAMGRLSKAALGMLGPDKWRRALQDATRQLAEKGGIARIDVVGEKVTGDVADVTLKIVYGNGTEELDKTSLVKEDGKWKIQPSSEK